MNYINPQNIPLALAVFLATDDYDYEPNTISATTLLKSVRQFILSKRVDAEDNPIDITNMVSARMGTAIHTAIEKAWTNPKAVLKKLGYPKQVYENIVINPVEVLGNQIPVYMEKRSYKNILGYTLSGKFDFVAEGKVQDFKSTSVYSYLNQSNKEKYILQGSIYRWLNPDIITKDTMLIHYIFTDWNKKDSMSNQNYPPNRIHTQELKLLSLKQIEQWITNKLTDINNYLLSEEQDLPLCTDEELWRKDTVWKYYKNPKKTSRSTKNFNTYQEALTYSILDGSVGIIKEVKGNVAACKYCSAFPICSQKDSLIQSGSLVI